MTIEQAAASTDEISQITELKGKLDIKDSQNVICAYFDFIEDESKTAEAQITDNFVESNYAVQDHIALKPKIYRLRGYVGEVLYTSPTYFENWLYNLLPYNVSNKIASAFSLGGAFSPIIGSYTKTAINIVRQLNDSFDRYKKIIENFMGKKELQGKRQETCNSLLFALMDNRVPVEIKGLAFERKRVKEYNSQYYIQSIQAHQGDSRFKSDFEVVLKEIRVAATNITDVKIVSENKSNAPQATNAINSGKASKIKAPTTAEKVLSQTREISAAPNRTLGQKIYNACRVGLEEARIKFLN